MKYSRDSKQAVLTYLASWMEERFRRVYTEEDSKKLTKGMLEAVCEVWPSALNHAVHAVTNGSNLYSAENFASSFRNSFLRFDEVKKSFDKIPELIRRPGVNIQAVQENYFGSYLRDYEKLKTLVEKVRAKSETKFPDKLSKEDMDSLARETFPKQGELGEFYDTLENDILLIQSFLAARGEVSKQEYRFVKKACENNRGLLRDIYRRMFADLYESTGEAGG